MLTFITLARAGGARPDILKWATHGPSGDIIDIYTSLPWDTICEAVACLKIDLRQQTASEVSAENHSNVKVPFLPFFYHQIPEPKTPEVSATSGVKVGGADGTRSRLQVNQYIRCFADLQQFTMLETNSYPAPFRLLPLMFGDLGKIWRGDWSTGYGAAGTQLT